MATLTCGLKHELSMTCNIQLGFMEYSKSVTREYSDQNLYITDARLSIHLQYGKIVLSGELGNGMMMFNATFVNIR